MVLTEIVYVEKSLMPPKTSLPRLLLTLPFGVRLCIVILSSVLCTSFYIWSYGQTHNGNILAIPVALAAWMFKRHGLFVCLGLVTLVAITYLTLRQGSIIWPFAVNLSLLGGVLVLLLLGLALCSLRDFVEEADTARLKAQEAEQQKTAAYEQQRQLNLIKNQFILNVNHELRTPLTALYGYLELFLFVLEREGHIDQETHLPFLRKAIQKCEELRSLVNNVLDTIQIDSNRESLKVEELSVIDIVQDVLDQFADIEHKEHPVQLAIPERITVWGNMQCMRHVLRNLLSNAFKYSPDGTAIIIGASLLGNDHREVCISLKDEGPGIPPDEISLLFGQFVRLQRDISGLVRGSGLGLYISKQLVEAMHGRIWVESTGVPGEGSLFCFTLPTIPVEKDRLPNKQLALASKRKRT